MANRWCDGFGRYGGTKSFMLNGSAGQAWAQVDASWALSTANPRTGTHHLRLTDFSTVCEARRVFGTPLTEVFVGMAVYMDELPFIEPTVGVFDASEADGFYLARFADAANGDQIFVYVGTDGGLVVYRADVNVGTAYLDWTLLGRSDPVIAAGAYQHVEIYAKAGNSTAGAIEIRVDEVTKLNLTGIDTVRTANVEFSQWGIGRLSGTVFAGGGKVDVADTFCNDTTDDSSACSTWVGDCKSGVLMVNADTAQADFTLSSGVSGYALLNEKPPSDASYIETAASTAESDFAIENGPASLSEVLTVRPFLRAWKDDAGTCTIAPNMKSGVTKGTVSGQPITTAAAYYDSNVPLDPATGVPWTLTGLNAALEVAERTA
jgi:hypothetical protein